MRKIVVSLFLLVFAAAVWGQGKGTSFFITSRSKTDQPAKPGQASDEATVAAHYLEDQVAIAIQNLFPCANATEDRDIAALLSWERNRALMDPNYEGDLSSYAGALGAKYVISVTAIQTGGQIYLQTTCLDTRTARSVQKADAQATSQDAADKAESLAKNFAEALGPLLAVNPESGKTYPVGSVFPAKFQVSYRSHAQYKWTSTKALVWMSNLGKFENPGRANGSHSLRHCGPEDWGSCGGCEDCSCEGECYIQIHSPGRYRFVNVSESLDGGDQKVEVLSEVTIEGSCKH